MLPELSEVRQRRKALGLTQAGLASRAGVSQSLVAKIESGAIVPGYDKARLIFGVLDEMHRQTKLTAGEVMTCKVITIKPSDTVRRAVQLMKKNAISQLPVVEGGNAVGTVSEMFVLERLGNPENAADLSNLEVREVMDEAMPVIRDNSPLDVVSALLDCNQAVLVARAGRICGIITKSDLLGVIIGKKGRGKQRAQQI